MKIKTFYYILVLLTGFLVFLAEAKAAETFIFGSYKVQENPNLKLGVTVDQVRRKIGVSNSVCNLLDSESSSVVSGANWKIPAGTWEYSLNTNSVPLSVGRSNFAVIASNSFKAWSDATTESHKILFEQDLKNTNISRAQFDGKNIIAWGKTPSSALGITYTWYDVNTGMVAETDTILNSRLKWSWSDPSGWQSQEKICSRENTYDVQNILTHEIGHWLGLADMYEETEYQDATMFGYASKEEVKKNSLSSGDVEGLKTIYYK